MRKLVVSLALLSVAMLALPQTTQAQNDPTNRAGRGAAMPTGWQVRLDDKDAQRNMTATDLTFTTMGSGMHVTTGPAAIFYNPADTAHAPFAVSASLTQVRAPRHPEAYGVFVGGSALQTANQQYLYFLVRGTGEYMISHRAGADVHSIVPWTANAAVKAQDDSGRATNALSIRVTADSVVFVANGTVVNAIARAQMHGFVPEGQAGLRVNHNLDVHIGSYALRRGQ